MYRIAIITASDKGAKGEREDVSGQVIRDMCRNFAQVSSYEVLADERDLLAAALIKLCDTDLADVVFTTGGTGFSPRDVTPEATLDVVERLAPGIPEAMRARSLQVTNRAMLTRAVAGIRKGTLIINLPGSPKAVRECLEVILPALPHGVDILRGNAGECAQK
ncbi:MAG: MogA/MoaB family molybdenum cofactor biosynthesis protein [Candidatus Pelethousia sp.]|nr:MogA/MoaB family molybdenum cofactor biosynthesis protein [Candidatus Pelethousia sp.]